MGQWSSGYDVALTTRRSPVQFRPGPLSFERKDEFKFSSVEVEDFLQIIALSGVTKKHVKEVERALENYAKYILFTINKKNSLEYFQKLQTSYSVKYYKKQMYAIRKFFHFLKIDWIDDIQLPEDPEPIPKHISGETIDQTFLYFKGHRHFLQIKALILLGITSGLRAEELYQLNPEDIDIENRIVHINHNPTNGQTTKTKHSRISFFNQEAQNALYEHIRCFRNSSSLKKLFSQAHLERIFRNAPIQIKDLRKFFSQEWDRRGGPTSIKKILMGHSLKGDVDLMHYNCQSEEDLERIYDRVMCS